MTYLWGKCVHYRTMKSITTTTKIVKGNDPFVLPRWIDVVKRECHLVVESMKEGMERGQSWVFIYTHFAWWERRRTKNDPQMNI